MHVMKIIWLLLAACPWMSPGWTDARRRRNIPEEIRTENIQNDMLKEMLRIERNHELSLSRPMPPKEKDIMRSFLEREFEDDDLSDSSPSTSRKHEISLSRPFPRKTMAIIQALLAGMPKDDDFHKDDDLSKDDDFHKGDELSEDDDLSDSSRFIPRNPEMFLSRPMPPKRMAIIRTLLQLESEDDDLSDRSRFIPRYAPYTSVFSRATLKCCPSVWEKIAPLGGISRKRRLLELYRDNDVTQRFYSTRCSSTIIDKPCLYINTTYTSKCKQLYSFVYALVKYLNVSEPYRLDFILVKSACLCEIEP